MNFNFTDEIIEIAKSKIPNNIKEKYIKESEVSFKYGYTRFEEDVLRAIYFYPNGYDIPKDSNFAETKAFINDLSNDELMEQLIRLKLVPSAFKRGGVVKKGK